jgi:hypothetical protein
MLTACCENGGKKRKRGRKENKRDKIARIKKDL